MLMRPLCKGGSSRTKCDLRLAICCDCVNGRDCLLTVCVMSRLDLDQEEPPQFDYRRHMGELLRDVLPIFLLVALAGFVLVVLFFPDRPVADFDDRSGAELPRVSLLAAASDEELSDRGISVRAPFDPAFVLARPIDQVVAPRATRFDAPMGSEHAALTYNAQGFLMNRHLGDDINGIGGQDSDLGDAVHAVADGRVCFAGWASDGWGNVIAVLHRSPVDGELVQSFYGHLESVRVPVDAEVRRGQIIGTVGKGDGRYLAHLHFEMRDYAALAAGAGYADQAQGRISGEPFLEKYRGVADDFLNLPVQGKPPVVPDSEAAVKMQMESGADSSVGKKTDGAQPGAEPAAVEPGVE